MSSRRRSHTLASGRTPGAAPQAALWQPMAAADGVFWEQLPHQNSCPTRLRAGQPRLVICLDQADALCGGGRVAQLASLTRAAPWLPLRAARHAQPACGVVASRVACLSLWRRPGAASGCPSLPLSACGQAPPAWLHQWLQRQDLNAAE